MTVNLSPDVRQQFEDANGNPIAGGLLFYYAAGTTTKQATYTTSSGNVANANPIVLDSAGRTPYGVWLSEGLSYKIVLAPAGDTDPPTSPIFTEDNISGINDNSGAASQWVASGFEPTYVNTTQFTVVGDRTATFLVNRRVRIVVGAGTVYGYISASAYTSVTTVTVVLDSGVLDVDIGSVDVGILTDLNGAIPPTVTRNTATQTLTNKSLSDSTTFIVDESDATKKAQFQVSGITTGTTRTFSLPDYDATLATVAGTETLTNKSLSDSTTFIVDNVDATKKIQFQASSITTGTTRTITMPDKNVTLGSDITRSARTSNTVLGVADGGKLIDITSGTFSQTFSAVATLGSGWFVYIRNSGTGDITLEPDGAEQIDGLTNYIMYPGETRLVQCDGSVLTTVVVQPFFKSFTSSGTFTKPPGYLSFAGLAWGGGGSGGKSGAAGQQGGGGGGGGCTPFNFLSADCGSTATVTIGAGGAAVSVAGPGNAGGNTTIALTSVTITAYGGGGGGGNGAADWSGGGGGGIFAAGSTASGTGNTTGGSPTDSAFGGGSSNSGGGSSTASTYGGGGGGVQSSPGAQSYSGGGGGGSTSSAGGASKLGGAGGAGAAASNGTAGTAPAGGGGSTRTGTNSGAGARGELRIWGNA